jgi:hypothetical protein
MPRCLGTSKKLMGGGALAMKTRLTRALLWLSPVVAALVIVNTADVASRSGDATPAVTSALVGTPSSCPVTVANGSTPPGERPTPGYHGNGQLWTSLWPDGMVLMRPEDTGSDGSMAMKWPWWRGVQGQLVIEGRRLDAPAPSLQADIPAGYGATGFQVTALLFPTEGCWEVTGHVGEASLTFVVRVVRKVSS